MDKYLCFLSLVVEVSLVKVLRCFRYVNLLGVILPLNRLVHH